MLYLAFLYYLINLSSTVKCTTTPEICVKQNSCLCIFDEYRQLDLSKLLGEQQNKTIFLHDTKDSYTYYFHGCQNADFISNNYHINFTDIPKVSLVRYDAAAQDLKRLGNAEQIEFHAAADKPDEYEIIYRNGSKITASIRLICDDFAHPLLNILNPAENQLTLASPQVCVKILPKHMSFGSILLILSLVYILIYFSVGSLILYYLRGARGIELIPNIDFWRQLPGLVRDGVIFLFSGCNVNLITPTDTYDRI